jgi:hypothetical protein
VHQGGELGGRPETGDAFAVRSNFTEAFFEPSAALADALFEASVDFG